MKGYIFLLVFTYEIRCFIKVNINFCVKSTAFCQNGFHSIPLWGGEGELELYIMD